MFFFSSLRSNILRPLCSDSLSYLIPNGFRQISYSSPLAFNSTPCLMALPTKKKRRVDPQILKMRQERKKRKIEKEIRALLRMAKTLKPIEEIRMPTVLYHNAESRRRKIDLPEDVEQDRILLIKEWSRMLSKHNKIVKEDLMKVIISQEKALNELQKVSTDLYNAAIQIDPNIVPFSFTGPTETPPIEGYNSPDGDYVDISKKWL